MPHEQESSRYNKSLPEKTRVLFESCGIDPMSINPKAIGIGGNHKVYRFNSGDKIVKIPINKGIGTVGSADEERDNIDTYLNYFPRFSVPTMFHASHQGYCVTMDFVDGRVVTVNDILTEGELNAVGYEVQEIISDNRRLIQETGKMIDLIGLEGLLWSVTGYISDAYPARLTNVRFDSKKDGLSIVDYDLIQVRDVYHPFEKIKSIFAYQLNKQTIYRHFGTDYP